MSPCDLIDVQLQLMKGKARPDVLRLSTTFLNLSILRKLAKIGQFGVLPILKNEISGRKTCDDPNYRHPLLFKWPDFLLFYLSILAGGSFWDDAPAAPQPAPAQAAPQMDLFASAPVPSQPSGPPPGAQFDLLGSMSPTPAPLVAQNEQNIAAPKNVGSKVGSERSTPENSNFPWEVWFL